MGLKSRLLQGYTTRATVIATMALIAAGTTVVVLNDSGVQATPTTTAKAEAPSALPRSFSPVIEKVGPAVVSIQVTQMAQAASASGQNQPPSGIPEGAEDFLKRFFGGDPSQQFRGQPGQNQRFRPMPRPSLQGAGSGFIIDPDGYIVTNDHVVRGSTEIRVKMQDGTEFDARLIGRDSLTDLAVLKVDAGRKLPYVAFSDAAAPKVGDWVVTIGNPFGLGHTVTAGIVSAHHRSIGQGPYDDFIQIDAPINKGNSGGPAFNIDGTVIGVNTAIFSPTGGSIGIGFAIPAAAAKRVVAELREKGTVARGWLGVHIQSVTPDLADSLGLDKPRGAMVSKVSNGGPAAKAGVKRGDLITEVDGQGVKNARALPGMVAKFPAGRSVSLGILRKGKQLKLTTVIGARPGSPEVASLPAEKKQLMGMQLSQLDPAARRQFGIPEDIHGVAVVAVAAGSRAAEKGIAPGDVIVEVGNEAVATPNDVRIRIERAKEHTRKTVLFLVSRRTEQRFVALPLRRA
jgi:serine protease Do